MQFSLLVQNRGRAEEARHFVEDGVDPQRCTRAPILFWTVCVFSQLYPISLVAMYETICNAEPPKRPERRNSLGLRPRGSDVSQRGKCNQREQQWAIFNLTTLLRLNEQTLPYCCEYTFHYSLGWAFRWPAVLVVSRQKLIPILRAENIYVDRSRSHKENESMNHLNWTGGRRHT